LLTKSNNNLDQIIYDIYNCIQNNKDDSDSKGFSRGILKLYHVFYIDYIEICIENKLEARYPRS
jgi:hypothetical protein